MINCRALVLECMSVYRVFWLNIWGSCGVLCVECRMSGFVLFDGICILLVLQLAQAADANGRKQLAIQKRMGQLQHILDQSKSPTAQVNTFICIYVNTYIYIYIYIYI